ncbi:hypothetical protein DPMN_025325 [Dreissena polymorpha]|uniref:Uncharacterized protein n=1 Tax=Dreissena polymorpha TaxID=45954 RepID=A0A9D4LR67_DREPO|nr:hypothetical protein DPMN_025325 [Dreissena polymorpha]
MWRLELIKVQLHIKFQNFQYSVLTQRQRPTRLVMGPCIVEIDRIVIREVPYQLEVNRCRNEEIIVKGSFSGVAYVGGASHVEIDCIVIKDDSVFNEEIIRGAPGLVMGPCIYQFEVNRCRNELIIVKSSFGWMWPMWAGRPRDEVQYQFEVNRCKNEEIIVKGNFGWAWLMWVGRPRVGNGAMHNNRCRNEDIIFKGFSAYSDERTEDGDNHNIPTFSPKSKGIITVIKLIGTLLLSSNSAIVSSFDQDFVFVEVKNVAPSPRGHVIQPTGLIFKLS